MSQTEALDNRLATIAFLIDTAVVPVTGRWRPWELETSSDVLWTWCRAYLYGPVWERENPFDDIGGLAWFERTKLGMERS